MAAPGDGPSAVEKRLQRRRHMRVAWRVGVPLVLLTAVLDHVGAFGYRGDDWRRFDRKTVIVQSVTTGDCFETNDTTIVVLLGAVAPDDASLRQRSFDDLRKRIEGRSVLLRLDVPQTRDEQGRLLANVYLSESDCLNIDLVHDGWAFADRRTVYQLRSTLEGTEAQARKKKSGMWAEVDTAQMPPWRQQWLAEQGKP